MRPSLGLIVKGDESVRVEPRSIDVLVALARRGRAVYPKRELIEAVWGETFVSDEVLTHAIWDLRKAFGDKASDPRFIQTIPKRGYRLIAEVEIIEPEDRAQPEPEPAHPRRLLWGALGVALVFVVLVALLARPETRATTVSPATRGVPGDWISLTVVPSSSAFNHREQSAALAEEVSSELAGKPDFLLEKADSCDPADLSAGGYCLEVRVTEADSGYEARIDLWQDGKGVWAPRKQPVNGELYKELAAQVANYFELLEMAYDRDPDLRPWIDLSKHNSRAVVALVQGMELVYQNEVGGRELLDDAIEIDPDFIAPRIIRIPTLVAEGDREQVLGHLQHLRSIETEATRFEKAMIRFADAHARGALAEEIRWLEQALSAEEGHRPVAYLLASRLFETGELEEACERLAELVESGWEYPPVFTDCVSCQILLGQVDATRATCDAALEFEHVDPQLLLMRVLLAIYLEEPETERSYRDRLEERIEQIAPEPFEFDSSAHQEKLARMAENAGRDAVAKRLLEFSR